MPNGNQRRGQAWMASQNIRREAQRIAAEQSIPEDEAVAAVFAAAELLAKCHGIPKAESIAADWAESR